MEVQIIMAVSYTHLESLAEDGAEETEEAAE